MSAADPQVPDPSAAARPILLGLAGDSASGKTTLSLGIEYVLGRERVSRLCTDDYHRYDRVTRARLGLTPLSPAANDIQTMEEHVRELSAGRSVVKPVYEHATGTFGAPRRFEPAEILIVEGLLAIAARGVRDALAVAVFLAPDETLRRRWKTERDVAERGYTPDAVRDELDRRAEDAAAHVAPQADLADIVVRFHRQAGRGADGELAARLVIRPTLPFPGLRELVGSLRRGGAQPVRWSLATDARGPMSVLDIDGSCPSDVGAELEEVIWSYLRPDERLQRERIGRYRPAGAAEHRSEALALVQLLIVSYLVGALDGAFGL